MDKGRVRPEDEWNGHRRRKEAHYEEDEYPEEYNDEVYEEPQVRQVRRVRPRPIQRIQPPQRTHRSQRTQRPYTPGVKHSQRISHPTRVLRSPMRPRRSRSIWPVLLSGCALGIFFTVVAAAVVIFFSVHTAQTGGIPIIGALGGTSKTFTNDTTQPITLNTLAQMQICNKIGNVSVVVDPHANTASIKTTKIVHTSSKASAEQEFGRINTSVQQPSTGTQSLTCATSAPAGTPPPTTTPATTASGGALLINTTIPNSDGLIHSAGDAVDITVTLTTKLFATASTPLQLNIQAAVGNVTVEGVSGIMNILGSSGDVTVTHATLINGSSIGTGQGNVTFNGILAAPGDTTTQASFVIRNETGKLDVTLPSSTNVILSANTNVGTIHSDFPITATTSSGSASYRGPLNTSAPVQSAAVLTVDVSTGDIFIHKGQV